jgi:2-polyprenyl-3-methyl-5-hydroxy-6-metoxy-1,4-benzoquinol methylase
MVKMEDIVENKNWNQIRELINGQDMQLGPYFGHQVLNSPRHLLFTLSRYKFAAKMLPRNRISKVLEVGCSEGIGSLLLAETGNEVVAVDMDKKAIDCANKNIKKQNITYQNADILKSNLGKFDAVISLDVIEHIEKADEPLFLQAIVNHLLPNGMCIIGTPNDTATQYASKASQIGHVNMYTAERLVTSLQQHFHHVFQFGVNDEIVHTGFSPMCHYLMVIGCSPK